MYELKEMERYLRVHMLGPGPRLTKLEKHCEKGQTLVSKCSASVRTNTWHYHAHSRAKKCTGE